RRPGGVSVAVRGQQDFSGLDHAAFRRDRPGSGLTIQAQDGSALHDLGASAAGGSVQLMNVPGGIECAASLVEQQPEVRTGPNFRPLLRRRYQLDSMVEDGCQKSLLGAKRREVRRLDGCLNMTAPLVFTIHRLVRDQTFERGKSFEGGLEELASARLPHLFDQCQRIEPQASQYLAAIARAGAPADPLTFQDHDIRASAGKLPSRGETRVTCTDDHNGGARGNWG